MTGPFIPDLPKGWKAKKGMRVAHHFGDKLVFGVISKVSRTAYITSIDLEWEHYKGNSFTSYTTDQYSDKEAKYVFTYNVKYSHMLLVLVTPTNEKILKLESIK
jgi:ribonuclease HII